MKTTLKYLFSLIAILFFSLANGQHTPKCDIEEQGSSDLKIIHVNSPCSPLRPKTLTLSWEDSVLHMQSNDKARLQYLSSLSTDRSSVPITSGRWSTQNPTYVVQAKLGTPAQTLLVALDTCNDVAWIPCSGCVGCSSVTYDPVKSSTFKPLACGAPQCKQVPNPSCGGTTCGFNTTYGNSVLTATLAQDNITLATDSISGYTFSCIQRASGSSFPTQGLLGLGRGPLSLLSQTNSLYKSTFSYCLPSHKSLTFAGSLWLGPNKQPNKIKTTPLLKNPKRPSFYYVNLLAIRVGKRIVKIPPSAFAFDPNTGAGTVFDSGTTFTQLVKPAYIAVRDEFRRLMGNATLSSLGGLDTCYYEHITVPTVTFLFSGMNVTYPQYNFIIRSTQGTTACLAMMAAPDTGVNSVLNVIASFQQQNNRILIDVPNSKLGIRHEPCSIKRLPISVVYPKLPFQNHNSNLCRSRRFNTDTTLGWRRNPNLCIQFHCRSSRTTHILSAGRNYQLGYNDDSHTEPFWLSMTRETMRTLRSLLLFLMEQPSQLKYIEWPSFQSTLKTATLTLGLVALLIVALSSVDSALSYLLALLLRKKL
ncbi:hypothetical protein RD792_010760 [Penstemon davidsonii]|uniref:Peptidase A1 domain-containing protein n=1 Tax=Penstemon davidsonii TaxID=160366 RepID=A0ABR0D3V7_9LAMI|nr:hypothetical protein RD792_010760 [Penstemon davidsonii]